jgi:hypothetical protein
MFVTINALYSYMSIRESINRYLGNDRPLDKPKLFKAAWSRMQSPQRTFSDCVDVYANATIGTFYGTKEDVKKRTMWAQIFSEVAKNQSADEQSQRVQIIINALEPEKRADIINVLFEHHPAGEEAPWIGDLFSQLAAYSRQDADQNIFEGFVRGVVRAKHIPTDMIDAYVPEIEQRRKAREALPFEKKSLQQIFGAAAPDIGLPEASEDAQQ